LDEQEAIRRRVLQLGMGKVPASPTAPLRQQMTSFNIAQTLEHQYQYRQIPSWASVADEATSFTLREQDHPHRIPAQDPQQRKQTEPLCSSGSKNTRITQTRRPAGEHTRRSRQSGKRHTGWMPVSRSPPPIRFNREPFQSARTSASRADLEATWGSATVAHAAATNPFSNENSSGGPFAPVFLGRHKPPRTYIWWK
jgi:hypothetical protein